MDKAMHDFVGVILMLIVGYGAYSGSGMLLTRIDPMSPAIPYGPVVIAAIALIGFLMVWNQKRSK